MTSGLVIELANYGVISYLNKTLMPHENAHIFGRSSKSEKKNYFDGMHTILNIVMFIFPLSVYYL